MISNRPIFFARSLFTIVSILAILLPRAVSAQSVVSLTLDSCLQLARDNNAAVRRAELEVERAHQVRMQAMTKFFPQVQATAVGYHSLKPIVDLGVDDIANASVRDLLLTLYGNYGAALGLDNTLSLFQHGVVAGVSAVQPVFMGGKIIAGNKLARLGEEAAVLQAQLSDRELMQQVEESYWLVVGLMDKQRTLTEATHLLDTLHHLVNSALEAGLAGETDLMQVEIKQAELSRQHLRLESGIRLARRALAQSVGLTVDSVVPIDTISAIESITAILPDYTSPEQQLLALKSRAASLQRTMTIADALPHVALGANYGYAHTDANILRNGLGGWNGALFAVVSVPLTGWWESAHKIKEQNILLEQARLEERDLTEKLSLRNQQVFNQMVEAQMLVEQMQRTVLLAERRYRLAEAAYRAGTEGITELLTAEMGWLNALNELTDARIAHRVQQRRYMDLFR